jgi:putative transposase
MNTSEGYRYYLVQIILKMLATELEVPRGKRVAEAAKRIGVTEQTHPRWTKKYGGLRVDQTKR